MSESPVNPEAIEQTRRAIHSLAREIAELSQRDIPADEYFQQFLERIVTAMAAVGGAVWTPSASGGLQLAHQVNFRITELAEGGDDELRHQRLQAAVLAQGEAVVVQPYASGTSDTDVGNPTRFLLLLAPLASDGVVEGLVEIFQRPGSPSDTQRGYLAFLGQMCAHAARWMQSRRLKQITQQHSLWQQVDAFSQTIHESLDRRETAYAIANEGQRILACDRVSVVLRHGRDYRLEAISGQDTFDTRSSMVGLLNTLVRRVLASGEPLHYAGTIADLPPQIVTALEAYVDHGHSKTILILPLRRPRSNVPTDQKHDEEPLPGEIIGALVCEQIDDSTPSPVLRERAELLGSHAARALANCHDHASLFLMPLWRMLGHSRVLVAARHLPKTIGVAVLIVALSVAAMLVRIDFAPEGKGELQPIEQRDVFAGIAGVITAVHADHGQQVTAGQRLVTLRNTDLMVQLESVAGQRQSTLERLLDVQRQLLENSTTSAEDRSRLAGELLQLRKQSESLDAQFALLQAKQKELIVASPIAGQVITWDTQKLLMNRPVTPGQVLLTVANPRGEWELVVRMPEDNMGYVQAAEKKQKPGTKLAASFVLATDPGRKLHGQVQRIHQLAELHPTDGQGVKIVIDIDENDLVDPRPGATATAQVHCGRRSVAFVWLHDVLEFFQTKVFF